MAKCPKCQSRKGKRYCPALDESICPRCCAEHRLGAIRCPQDCEYLQAEYYQLERRQQRARSHGRQFLTTLQRNFLTDAGRKFAYSLQADVYWWTKKHDRLDNRTLAAALKRVGELFATVLVPAGTPHPLTRFLHDLLKESPRYTSLSSTDFTSEHRNRCIDTLVRCVDRHGKADGYSYHDEISSFFDSLDFEADLGYCPDEELEQRTDTPRGYRDAGAGLIVPDA